MSKLSKHVVLVADDEKSIRRFLKVSLESNGFICLEATNGIEALNSSANDKPDIIVLDLEMPEMSGFDVIERIRQWTKTPIIVLTVHDRDEEKIKALDLGADDYLTKPFSVPELMARIRVALRHASNSQLTKQEPSFCQGDFKIDFTAHRVLLQGQEVQLSHTEYEILRVLALNAGRVVTHRMLLSEVWGPNAVEHVQYVRVYMGQIRKKLRELSGTKGTELIRTEPGVGYRFITE